MLLSAARAEPAIQADPAGYWADRGESPALVISPDLDDVQVVHRLSIGGRAVTWRGPVVWRDESAVVPVRIPRGALVHPAMVDHTLLLQTRLETRHAKQSIASRGVRIADLGGEWLQMEMLPQFTGKDDSPDAFNPASRVIAYDEDLMRKVEEVVLEPLELDVQEVTP
jgi:hypothetical protein